MNPRDELIRRAMMHLRSGYALGGKPGESAMARTEASRSVSSGPSNVGGVRDGGFGGAGPSSLGGNGGGNRDMGPQMSNAGAKGDFGPSGHQTSNLAAKADRLDASPMGSFPSFNSPQLAGSVADMVRGYTSSGNPTISPVSASPGYGTGDVALNRAMGVIASMSPASRPSFSALTGMSPAASQAAVMRQNTPTNFNAPSAQMAYSSSLPSTSSPLEGYLGQISNYAAKGDYAPNQVSNISRKTEFDAPADIYASAMSVPSSAKFSGFGLPSFQDPNIGDVVAGTMPEGVSGLAVNDQGLFASSMPSRLAMQGIPQPDRVAGYLGSQTFNTGPRAQTITESTPTKVGQMIAGLKSALGNPALSAAQKAQLKSDLEELDAMGGIAVSPGSSFAKAPEGFVVDPQTGVISKSPGYNVVAGPYAKMPSPVGDFRNISFAMPSGVPLAQNRTVPNPSYREVPMEMQASLLSSATQPTRSIAAPAAPQMAAGPSFEAYGRGTPSYAQPAPQAAQMAAAPSFETYGRGTPSYSPMADVTPMAAPAPAEQAVTKALALASQPQYFDADRAFPNAGRGDGRPDRVEGAPRIPAKDRQALLDLGYTPDEIKAMTPEEIAALLQPQEAAPAEGVVASARGGRIGYAKGGKSNDEASTSTSTPTRPIALPALPDFKPPTMPQYNFPSASPMIQNFLGSMNQQPMFPQQPTMPAQGASSAGLYGAVPQFGSPAMGISTPAPNGGVNALRYNPSLMDERPDYALVNNNSLSNAMRMVRG